MTICADSAAHDSGDQDRSETNVFDQPPALDRQGVSQLFSSHVGDPQSPRKSAGRTAWLLEEQFIVDGWPTGRYYGHESDLARRYGVGRPIMRETARILEARGTARMRRGQSGGLEVTAPSIDSVHERITSYCYLIGVSRDHLRTARLALSHLAMYGAANERGKHCAFIRSADRDFVDPSAGNELQRARHAAAGNSVVAFFLDCLDALRELESRPGGSDWRANERHPANHASEGIHRTRAAKIAHALTQSLAPGQWTDGLVLGNELDLCERYGVDRRVLRQAIRILEADEMAATLPGRGHGLVARSPGAASISRLICCYFAANRFCYHETFRAFQWLSAEIMALAACCATAKSLEPISATLAALSTRPDAVSFGELSAIEDQLLALTSNPVMDLFLRSTKGFASWAMYGVLPMPPRDMRREFLECNIEAAAAIAAGDPLAASAAQERKFHAPHPFLRSAPVPPSVARE